MKPVEWFSREVTKHTRPVVRDFLIHVYDNPENYLDPDQKEATNQLIKFQMALKKIPNWTNTQIKKQIDEITVRCPGFKKLLVALFVSYIKMISDGIRTNSKSRRLDVKLPSDETFVHTCFVDCAHNLYEDPYVMKKSENERISELDKRLQDCIMNSIDKLIPTMDIINNYIPSMNDEVCFNSNDDADADTEALKESDSAAALAATTAAAGAGAAAAPIAGPANVEPVTEDGGGCGEEDEDEDGKKIPVGTRAGGGTELFPDAPDKISTSQ